MPLPSVDRRVFAALDRRGPKPRLARRRKQEDLGSASAKNTPTEIVDKLNNEINAALANPQVKARLVDLGGTVLALSPPDFGKLITDDTEKWGKVIRAANIKPE